MDTQEKLARLKHLFALTGKKFPGDAAALDLIKKLDRSHLYATIITHAVGLGIYFAAGAVAGALLGLAHPLGAGAAFVVIRLALNYSPTQEEAIAKVNLDKKVLGEAIENAPVDPAVLSEILGQSAFNNPDTTPKA